MCQLLVLNQLTVFVPATDVNQMQLPDGVVMPPLQAVPSPYDRYLYTPADSDPYNIPSNYMFPATSKPYEKSSHEEIHYGYSTYTPSQFSSHSSDQQIYSNPYYSNSYATQNNATIVTDTQTFSNVNPVNMNQANSNQVPNQGYEPYLNQMGPIPESSMSAYSAANQTDLAANFAQMQVSATKSEPMPYGPDYSNTFYSVQYPNVSTPNSANYTSAPQNSSTSIAPSHMPSDYSTLNYPYNNESTQYSQQLPATAAYSSADPNYSYATTFASTSQGYTYSNAITSTSSIANTSSVPYSYPSEIDSNYSQALAQLDAYDKPIKSHTTGEALSNMSFQPAYQNYSPNVASYSNQPDSYNPTSTYGYTDQSNTNTAYGQTYQNHPGYNFNTSTGNYEYSFGSQNSFTGYDSSVVQPDVNVQPTDKDPNWPQQGIYTNAGKIGTCETVQSPTENPQIVPQMPIDQGSNQTYYNNPYGYQTVTSPTNEVAPDPQPVSTNYGANTNLSTYMQSGHEHNTSVTFSSNQGKIL